MTQADLLSALAALAYVVGGVCMKATEDLQRPLWLIGVYAGFLVGCTLQTVAMRGQDLGANYIMVLGLEAAIAFGVGVWWFSEPVSASRIGGVALVVAGIALLRA